MSKKVIHLLTKGNMLKKPTHSFDDYSPKHYSVSAHISQTLSRFTIYSDHNQKKPKIHNLKCKKKKKRKPPKRSRS